MGWPGRRRVPSALADVALLLLSAALAFGLWFGSGWLLAAQVVPREATPLVDDPVLASPPILNGTDSGVPEVWEELP